jgi:hypothetical protein
MPVLVIAKAPGVTADQDQALIDALSLKSDQPRGAEFRLAGPSSGGRRIISLWESREAFDTFLRDRLAPALERAGRELPEFEYWPIETVMNWRAEEPQQGGARRSATRSGARRTSARRTTIRRATAKRAPAKSGPARKSTPKKSTAKKSTAKKSTAKKSTAKKSTGKKSTARKTTAKKSTARKTTAKKTTAKKTSKRTTGRR